MPKVVIDLGKIPAPVAIMLHWDAFHQSCEQPPYLSLDTPNLTCISGTDTPGSAYIIKVPGYIGTIGM